MPPPSIPKGTRDFTPEQVNRRNYIFDNSCSGDDDCQWFTDLILPTRGI